ncbi:Crp/Fnr family transcriptional regulator [Reichenbachiella versicolor]|uniref:Crp/Fnr family transcriptional regulator n=1 Tax=Reichenbachiella versicolor TaxID=1821036 RepID=UPI000D6E81B7|nr:Crp/Fnr family transcriptional regulator [Reichenbachiella versicolor]
MKEFLQSFEILTSDEIESFISLLRPKTVNKGSYYIKAGQVAKEVSFIQSGIARSFYYSSTSEEVTYCFRSENSFLAAYSSFISQTPTSENIQALTDLKLLSVSWQEVKRLEATSPNWLRMLKHLTELEYIDMEARIFQLQRETAEKRYQDLLNNQPEYLNMIPLNYIASYLGITQRHLSRIRKGISN